MKLQGPFLCWKRKSIQRLSFLFTESKRLKSTRTKSGSAASHPTENSLQQRARIQPSMFTMWRNCDRNLPRILPSFADPVRKNPFHFSLGVRTARCFLRVVVPTQAFVFSILEREKSSKFFKSTQIPFRLVHGSPTMHIFFRVEVARTRHSVSGMLEAPSLCRVGKSNTEFKTWF